MYIKAKFCAFNVFYDTIGRIFSHYARLRAREKTIHLDG